MSFLSKQSPEVGFTAKFDRQNRYVLRRRRTPVGLFEYILENSMSQEKLTIPRYLFDRFRATMQLMADQLDEERLPSKEIDHKMYFKDRECYRFRYSTQTIDHLVINSLIHNSSLKAPKDAIPVLIKLMFHEGLEHPSDTFDAIIDYHRLFQFSFVEGSESITSGLILRKNVLSENDNYTPSLEPQAQENKVFYPGEQFQEGELKGIAPIASSGSPKEGSFKSKLGHRNQSDKNYSVDYDSLFSQKAASETSGTPDPKPKPASFKRSGNTFPLPLLASDIKAAKSKVFKVELSMEDAAAFRDDFLTDRSCDLFLGFEIMDTIHKVNGKLKTYRFPLYYMKVKVEESGRFLHMTPPKEQDIYLNHIALITLVETHSGKKGDEPLQRFLDHLLAQKIEVSKDLYPMKIVRQLPFSDEVFQQARDILIGQPGDQGKGGILENLKVIGIECDLESVIVYKVGRVATPTSTALNKDLSQIQQLAHEQPERFYQSLLGRFLVPERRVDRERSDLGILAMNPGYRPRSTQQLMSHLNEHDLILLEGPPGTGKTFTIMNLFIHCVNHGKRLLIVSDQKAALHALTEKMEEYLVGADYNTPFGKKTLSLWKSAIRVVDEVADETDDLKTWTAKLIKMLELDYCREQDWPDRDDRLVDKLNKLDQSQEVLRKQLSDILERRFGGRKGETKVAPKSFHPTTEGDIRNLVDFLHFIGAGEHSKIRQTEDYVNNQELAKRFIVNREQMSDGVLAPCYACFAIDVDDLGVCVDFTMKHGVILDKLVATKPRTLADFREAFPDDDRSEFSNFLLEHWQKAFTDENTGLIKKISSLISHPCLPLWKQLAGFLQDQKTLLEEVSKMERSYGIMSQLQEIHKSLDPDQQSEKTSAALEICRLTQDDSAVAKESVHRILRQMADLQADRDRLIYQQFLTRLGDICLEVIKPRKNGTNLVTSINNLLESLKDSKTIDHGSGVPVLKELQERLVEAFPVWLCRKQSASFLFPSQADQFDLVIVDEAGQCRVDDAIPLLYRAKKLMVVGDEKQTVLDKNSVVDDYLFSEFELEEQLRTSQARGVKGGGSNLFALVKSIKQGGVMLDEHYRCPPDIIAYSNRYVYNSELKIMQWQHPTASSSVVVDYREKNQEPSKKPTSGRFKGIEVDMIDRFFDFVAETVKALESETGERINMETDVALCYFLLKNEPYVKEQKSKFLQKLRRGNDVLDGAGAALQGKERKYIFYLWDINRSNLTFFRQGDDPDKRKGELNVLMSRPKVRAYHYLHHSFDSLKHETASITDYLWKTLQSQDLSEAEQGFKNKRTKRPARDFSPWQRSSGQTILAILSFIWKTRGLEFHDPGEQTHCSVVVGDPRRKVDLMVLAPPGGKQKCVGVVDLSAFEDAQNPCEELINYYFQLQRVKPAMEPVFAFLHEIADERSETYRDLENLVRSLIS
ncbi:AAA domain-containing protein [Pseudobacteriovorax antillogorgiicola]|uniref:AAA domain-containing protein n=1 Tax=Pseudobacteriovorax antillogorgiicola TaxID=1513793 RepID=A0A1Y6BJ21_9BACT|nr:AAA domain-containing protein [Pseudobacteriovorax antillogorgiicola]TCS56382.1 AAA domain-containing protein [Pseudobacteriovorax antillogorgiicola]SMF06367.1 AAA domain-containing protein [Pseudobacteriovorax antillogorgiicola]